MFNEEDYFVQPIGQDGQAGEAIWIVPAESVILFISVPLLGKIVFFLIKDTYFYAGSLRVTPRCAIVGPARRLVVTLFVLSAIIWCLSVSRITSTVHVSLG